MQTLTKETLRNDKCFIEFIPETKKIFGRDLTDRYNEPAFYNETVRSAKKAWAVLQKEFHDDMTMHQAMRILMDNNVRCHSWCMMD